jgi:hypothetical protein
LEIILDMKWLFAVIAFLLVPLPGLCAQAEGHQHPDTGHHKLSLDHGKKWETDAPLRNSMDALRLAFQAKLDDIHRGKLSSSEYAKLGNATHAEVANIVAKCKLSPDADAVLHLIIADMLAGADIMTGKAKGKPANGAHKVVAALNSYGHYFNHPGWAMLKG